MFELTVQPQYCSTPKARKWGRNNSVHSGAYTGLFLLPRWLTTVGQALHPLFTLLSCPSSDALFYPFRNDDVSPGKGKKVQPVSSTVGSKCTYKFQCYLSNFFSTHFATVQDKKPFSTMIWPKTFKELMSDWHGKNKSCPNINFWK